LDSNTNPGLVALKSKKIPKEVKKFAKKALYKVLDIKEVFDIIKSSNKYSYFSMGNGRGLIGALSAIGNDLINEDFTYELLAYRRRDFVGKKRRIKENSIWKLEEINTFANIDYETKRILIYPRGRDPVLFGIRVRIRKLCTKHFI